MHSHEDLLTAFSLSAVLRLRRRFQALAELYRQQRGNTSCGAANRRSEKNAFSEAASIFPLRLPLWGLKGASSPFLATATTAACGGNREELLGPRSAGHECRPRHEVDAGYRNPSDPARRNRWWFSGSLLTSKENISLNERALYPRAPAREAGVFLVLFWHAKENLAPMQKRSDSAPPARNAALRHIKNAPQSPLRFHRAS